MVIEVIVVYMATGVNRYVWTIEVYMTLIVYGTDRSILGHGSMSEHMGDT